MAGLTDRIINGGFETGTFLGWTQRSVGSLSTVVDNDVSRIGVWPPHSGIHSAVMVTSDGGVLGPHRDIYQDVDLPNAGPLILTFWYGLTHVFSRGIATVSLYDTSDNLLTVLFSHNSAVSQVPNWTEVNVSVKAYAGRTVRLVFAVAISVANVGNVFFSMDDISLFGGESRRARIFVSS